MHEECVTLFKNAVAAGDFFVSGINQIDHQAIQDHVKGNFFWMIEIHGEDGKYLNVVKIDELKNLDLPHRIRKVVFGNKGIYEFHTAKKPAIYFEVSIDFSTARILDLFSSPSRSTPNESFFEITGINSFSVLGIAAEFEAFFKKHKNINYIVNLESVYDVSLWFAFLPLTVFFLINQNSVVPEKIVATSNPLQLAFSIIVFFEILLIFRLLFNATRWFFPCQELSSQTSKKRLVAKYIFSACITGVLGTIAYNFIRWFAERLF